MIQETTKRLIDLAFATVLLLALSPILLLISLAIKIDSEGPVFVEVSNRVGKNGKSFRMYKFRTMIKNAHQVIKTNPKYKKLMVEWKKNSFKLDRDPRITPLGSWLRRFSLDEFPQLINVIKGEMSLVGPRALYLEEFKMQKKKHNDLAHLFDHIVKVKPGISGVWQVSGRSEVSFRDRLQIDAAFASDPNLWTYLKVIAKTPLAVLGGKGAQ